jgi:hypothetical protein
LRSLDNVLQRVVRYYAPLLFTVFSIPQLAGEYRLPIHCISLFSPAQWPRHVCNFSVAVSMLMVPCKLDLLGIQIGVIITQCCLSFSLSVMYVTVLFRCRDYVAWDGMMMGEWLVGRSLGGNGCDVIEVLSRHLTGDTRENHEKIGQDIRYPGRYSNRASPE